jgi:hypothetical protein
MSSVSVVLKTTALKPKYERDCLPFYQGIPQLL